ncbi:MAG TPA: CheR family methyltransferase [Blastocatellia bacterium]|nr:CheR family methyltransferase [Blastocatellia bacterium]
MNAEIANAEQSNSEFAIRPITDREFLLFQTLIHNQAGIHLGPAKKALLVGRLTRRLRELGLTTFRAYYDRVTDGSDPVEQVRMLDSICTNETRFFREKRQFEFLAERVFSEWESDAAAGTRSRQLRVWSTACSTGEEPFSLAMALLDRFPPTAWTVRILATDLSTRALDRAREAIWPIEKSRDIPPHYLKAFMLRGNRSQEGRMKAGPEIRSVVEFARVNLNDGSYPVSGPFDLIFCRNVLIYFDAACKARVVDRLLDALAPGGYLLVGHAESLNGLTCRARAAAPTIYVKTGTRPGSHGLTASVKL